MKKHLFIFVMSLLCNNIFGQKGGNQMGIKPYLRYDWYPETSYNYANRYSTNYLKMQGMSWGVDANYRFRRDNDLNYNIGLGFLRYRFNKLNNINSNFGRSNSRSIDYAYSGQPDMGFATDRYFYNSLSINIGVERRFNLNDKAFVTGFEINNFITFSQGYHITGHNFTTKLKDKSLFGHSFQGTFGIVKRLKSSSIIPLVSIPIFSIWQKDDNFLENQDERRSKWFKGLALGIQYNFSTKRL